MTEVDFIVQKKYLFEQDLSGLASMKDVPHQESLYVIWSKHHSRFVYAGFAKDLALEIENYVKVLNATGIEASKLKDIHMFSIKAKVEGKEYEVDRKGLVKGMDLEHLLIRMYVKHFQCPTRNAHKWDTPFKNKSSSGLALKYYDADENVGVLREQYAIKGADGAYVTLLERGDKLY